MDFEFENLPTDATAGGTPAGREVRRVKSSLRLKYEAETHYIERKIGDLETVRAKLGLSQRKMAQLLLVDPSAWTRWTKGDDQAPPHVFRMLQWYLALEDKYPALDVNFWLNTVAQIPQTTTENDRAELAAARAQLDVSRQALEAAKREIESVRAAIPAPRAGGGWVQQALMVSLAIATGVLVGFLVARFR